MGLDFVGDVPGWALTETAAAVAYDAPVAASGKQLLEFYVIDEVMVRRAVSLLGAATSGATAQCSVRVAPIKTVCLERVSRSGGWPLAHPLFVALDLAQDEGRGREVLDAWIPPEPWSRVW